MYENEKDQSNNKNSCKEKFNAIIYGPGVTPLPFSLVFTLSICEVCKDKLYAEMLLNA